MKGMVGLFFFNVFTFEISGERRGGRDDCVCILKVLFIIFKYLLFYNKQTSLCCPKFLSNDTSEYQVRCTRVKHAMCVYPRELGRMGFPLAVQLTCAHRLRIVDNNTSVSW